jgi:hypothetical protein
LPQRLAEDEELEAKGEERLSTKGLKQATPNSDDGKEGQQRTSPKTPKTERKRAHDDGARWRCVSTAAQGGELRGRDRRSSQVPRASLAVSPQPAQASAMCRVDLIDWLA